MLNYKRGPRRGPLLSHLPDSSLKQGEVVQQAVILVFSPVVFLLSTLFKSESLEYKKRLYSAMEKYLPPS